MQQQWWIPHHSMFLINFVAAATNTEPEMEGKAAAAAQNSRLNRRLVKRSHPSLSYFFFVLPHRIQLTHHYLLYLLLGRVWLENDGIFSQL